jgi:hypothetical protein
MMFTGHIHDGKVVFDTPVPLPEGTPVRVEPAAVNGPPSATPPTTPPDGIPTLYERLKDVIGAADDPGLPADGALNHDYYLYGLPKKS